MTVASPTSSLVITAIAPWFGGKRTMAPVIVGELGKHRAYWEPFCGGMSVLLNKEPSSMETVNDLHGDLINLARVIQDRVVGPCLYRRLRRIVMNEGALIDACTFIDEHPVPAGLDIDRAQAYFVQSWMMRSGVAGTHLGRRGAGRCIAVRYTSNGGSATSRWRNAVNSIVQWRRRLQNVMVLNRDGFDVLAKIDDSPGTAIYCDPPYLSPTRSGLKGSGATSRYLHEFDDGFMVGANDHERLASLLIRFKRARVVVSYYAHHSLSALYPGWTLKDCTTKKAMVSQSCRGDTNSTAAPEILLINGPSYTAEAST